LNPLLERLRAVPKSAWLISLLVIAGLSGFIIARQMVANLPKIDTLENYTPPLVTRIYDIHGELVTELYTERRTVIPLKDIPAPLKDAILATEDEHFYEHWGINPKGIARAMLTNIRHGRVVEGGSTITQQISKVLFFGQQKTFTRKIRELLLALQLEHRYSKDEILQLYLNQIYFGHGAYGVESAAKVFFGKTTSQMTLAECALLAGLPRSPRNYSPFVNADRAQNRRAWVLSRMRRSGFISDDQEKEANAVPLNTTRAAVLPPTGAYFVEYLRQQLEPKYGDNALYQDGFSIYTTLDVRMQRAAEEVMNQYLGEFDKVKQKELDTLLAAEAKKKKKKKDDTSAPEVSGSTNVVKVQGAMVAIDPRTGGIRAMIGGRDYRETQLNRSVQSQRQPGSAFKPFVWAAALDGSMTEASMIDDDRVAFYNDGRDWRLLESATDAYAIAVATAPYPADQVWVPQNWDFKYFGRVTMRTGLAMSRNLVSIRVAEHLGAPAIMEMALRCGIMTPLKPILSIALGTQEVNLLELTGAYATFANGGIRPAPYGIIRVEDKNGKVLEEHSPQLQVALSAQTAYLMVDSLRAVVTGGTGGKALELGRPVGGKTGTNQASRDLWFVGFTPDVVAGAWMGYDDFSPLGKGRAYTASAQVLPWWTAFMKKAHEGISAKNFETPPDIVFVKIDKQTGYLALPTCPKVVLAAFRKGTDPKDLCPVDHLAQHIQELDTEE